MAQVIAKSKKVQKGPATRASRRKPESLAKLKQAARKLFVERGYHATRPQDIARGAGLGHGTFYLYYPDKRACFMDFVDDARKELGACIQAATSGKQTLEAYVASMLNASFDYAASNPGVINVALTDEIVIGAEGVQAKPLFEIWGGLWANFVRTHAESGTVARDYNPEVIGLAIVGALHLPLAESWRTGRPREEVIDNVTRFLKRALCS